MGPLSVCFRYRCVLFYNPFAANDLSLRFGVVCMPVQISTSSEIRGPIQMLYKPNFCCHCGEKIERLSWSPLTSRRFCELCETEKKPYDLLIRSIVAISVLFGVFGVARLVSNDAGPSAKSAKVQQSAATKREIISRANIERTPEDGNAVNASNARPLTPNTNSVAAASPGSENLKQRGNEAKTSTETTYYCNAMTKKGTPCTRRVKTKGRCWQHVGQTAIVEF